MLNFDLVRWGWPNAVAVLALAAVPFMSMLAPSAKQPVAYQVELTQTDDQPPIDVAAVAE